MADDEAPKKAEAPKAPPPEPTVEVVDNKMLDKPYVAPDGHVVLSKEDIANRV